ncbi:hypothetical protein H8K33_11770 [Undibacterium amnicola]|uniref:Alkaline phytoceramidase n=1 Tax=Undibacterium amnicola TaxID=1834038 RepID=A0ABR6XTG8_9BURK|nr:hypothetical protein [Undibacterium amnicola]MBC3832192.1 hypothetical protein [Undibacterium amnicola]
MESKWRLLPAVVVLVCAISMLMYGVIPQYDAYHVFADSKTYLGIPNAMDVLSNIAFGLTGLMGLIGLSLAWILGRRWGAQVTADRWQPRDIAYLVFVVSIFATSFGSGFYHWAPDDARLFWDRLPIACACASLLAAVRIEAMNVRRFSVAAANVLVLLLFALISVLWWKNTGDLRLYLVLQLLAIVLIPLWQMTYPTMRQTRWVFAIAIGMYVSAKVAEILDVAILSHTGFISGHTIKHLLASGAAALIIWNWLSAKCVHASAATTDLKRSV